MASAGRFWPFATSAARSAAVSQHATTSLPSSLRGSRLAVPVTNDWQVMDFYSRAEQEPAIIFTEADIEETATEMLGGCYSVDEPEDAVGADAVMRAAEAQMTRNPLTELMPVIRSMLRDPNIQRAAIAHLRQSEHFQQYLTASAANQPAIPLQLEWGPTVVDQGSGVDESAGLQELMEELGAKLVAAGEAALKTAVGLRNALGRLLIHLGVSVHALLGRPFSKTPLEEGMSAQDVDENAEIVGQALITVAIAILSIVFLKRMHLVTAL